MNQRTKDNLLMGCIMAGAFAGLVGLGYMAYLSDIPIKTEGKVIGTFVSSEGFGARSECAVEIDGKRYDTRSGCYNLVGDIVKVNKYKSYVLILRE